MPDRPFLVMPLDARPVCYDQVLDLARIGGVSVALPPPELLGVLKRPAPFEPLQQWWLETLQTLGKASLILSLDTLAYGGLIAGRVNTEPLETLQARAESFLKPLGGTQRPRYGFSSILRIPDYDNAEEEPDYWATYGRTLYQFSVETHRQGSMPADMFNKIPGDVLQDFLSRREKNFNLNQHFLRLLQKSSLDYLVYCQDDTGPYGMNVKEAEFLRNTLTKKSLTSQAYVQTGADEVALTLLAKGLWAKEPKPLKVFPWYVPEHGKKVMAKFDGMPVGQVVQRQLQTLGAVTCLSPTDADLVLLVNAPSDKMGDHCAPQAGLVRPKEAVAELVNTLKTWLPKKNVAMADVVSANGSDPATTEAMLNAGLPVAQLAGYAGWNTPGNAIGTALAMGAVVTWAQRHGRLDESARQALLLKRFLDDWYYQAHVRMQLKKASPILPSASGLQQAMQPGIDTLKPLFDMNHVAPRVTFPCNRFFEVTIQL